MFVEFLNSLPKRFTSMHTFAIIEIVYGFPNPAARPQTPAGSPRSGGKNLLEKHDLETIGKIVDEKMDKRFEEYDKKMDKRFEEFGKTMDEKMDHRLHETESMLLDEIDRVRRYQEKQTQELKQDIRKLKELNQCVRLQNDTITLILQIVQNLQERMEVIERKIA